MYCIPMRFPYPFSYWELLHYTVTETCKITKPADTKQSSKYGEKIFMINYVFSKRPGDSYL